MRQPVNGLILMPTVLSIGKTRKDSCHQWHQRSKAWSLAPRQARQPTTLGRGKRESRDSFRSGVREQHLNSSYVRSSSNHVHEDVARIGLVLRLGLSQLGERKRHGLLRELSTLSQMPLSLCSRGDRNCGSQRGRVLCKPWPSHPTDPRPTFPDALPVLPLARGPVPSRGAHTASRRAVSASGWCGYQHDDSKGPLQVWGEGALERRGALLDSMHRTRVLAGVHVRIELCCGLRRRSRSERRLRRVRL